MIRKKNLDLSQIAELKYVLNQKPYSDHPHIEVMVTFLNKLFSELDFAIDHSKSFRAPEKYKGKEYRMGKWERIE